MRSVFVALLTIISFSVFSQPKEEAEVRNVLAKQNAAWNRGDVDASFSKKKINREVYLWI